MLDAMNAMHCMTVARCAGADKVKPEDFMVLKQTEKEESRVPVQGDDPATIERKLKLLTASMGGEV